MLTILLAMLMTNYTHFTNEEEPILIYIGDPMCSWCYGISEDLGKVADAYEGQLKFQIVVGGLRPGGGEKWDDQFTSFLQHHWEEVSARSGAEFSYDLLSRPDFDYDTEPSCRAVVVARSIDPTKSLVFFQAVQRRFYYDNEDPKQVSFYEPICDELGISYEQFSSLFESEEMKLATASDFQDAKNMGVTSFPTVVLKYKGQYHMVAKGYSDFETMQRVIERIIDAAK